jgi:hypothetical protein
MNPVRRIHMPTKYIKKLRKSIQERFEEKFSVSPDSDCWIWNASKNSKGYGTFSFEKRGTEGAHRASWLIYRGEIPKSMYVLHHCDHAYCVNPDHLFLGTNSDNMQDCAQKNRIYRPKGIIHPRHKLTEQQIMEIRNDKRLHKIVAIDYRVTEATISSIVTRRTWGHL